MEHKRPYSFLRDSTGVPLELLRKVAKQLTRLPKDFQAHRGLVRHLEARKKVVADGAGIDWASAEALALGSLLQENFSVRLSGQDTERGTFSQRHGIWIDQATEERYMPLEKLAQGDNRIEIINTMLSEFAVLGFEYGYSLAAPHCLTLWEAQFGDFANGAQVIIDQFIASAERKWFRMSGLVMLLPHGYEGQGPEHSSARMERYLQLCAEDNIQVANCSTPANYFHILRRQMHRKFRKPLVLFTPKSLLRHRLCVSDLQEIAPKTSFHRVLWDNDDPRRAPAQRAGKLQEPKKIKRVVMCSGKIYYDLLAARREQKCDDIYLLRVEQLHPYPTSAMEKELKPFAHAEMIWAQEEPHNMGAYSYIAPWLRRTLQNIGAQHTEALYVGRRAAASTATGFLAQHNQQQQRIIEAALADNVAEKVADYIAAEQQKQAGE